MKRLPLPTTNAKDTFFLCISKVRNFDLKKKLTACEALVIEAETEFSSKITKGLIYTIPKESIVNKNVSVNEMEKIYTNRMAKASVVGRSIYDKIISAAELEICPLCNQRSVETLDHYLPKAFFPRLVVTPINLVPACISCNKKKLSSIPTNPSEETLHPYFDNVEYDEWIYATLNKTSPPTVTFFVDAPSHWSDLLKNRAEYHLYSYSLNHLYGVQSAKVFQFLNHRLREIHLKAGSGGVHKYLKEEAKSRKVVDLNSWQAVLYTTLYQDKWFCDGGFRF